VEPPAGRADTIASAIESGPPADRNRKLLVGATVILAVTTAAATLVATDYGHQVSQLRAHPSAASSASAVPTPAQQATPISAASTPAASTRAATAAPTVSAPPLTMRAFDLEMSRPRVTVYLTAAAADGVGFTDGQLVVTALVRGGQPGARYRLTGGDCDRDAGDKVWAEGLADTTGTALLTGPTWTLPKADQYFLFIETLPTGATTPAVTGAGLGGVFLLSGLLNPRQPGQSPCL